MHIQWRQMKNRDKDRLKIKSHLLFHNQVISTVTAFVISFQSLFSQCKICICVCFYEYVCTYVEWDEKVYCIQKFTFRILKIWLDVKMSPYAIEYSAQLQLKESAHIESIIIIIYSTSPLFLCIYFQMLPFKIMLNKSVGIISDNSHCLI
jgi:hypothetical protein